MQLGRDEAEEAAAVSALDELNLNRRASDMTGLGVGLQPVPLGQGNGKQYEVATAIESDADLIAALAPSTPKGAKKKMGAAAPPVPPRSGNGGGGAPAWDDADDAHEGGAGAAGGGNKVVRRVKSSSTMREVELNRTAPAPSKAALQQPTVKIADAELLPGFVTCLNSRNVSKYRKGQKYRDGLIIGIDEEHGKIIVYNENMPRGALTIIKTRDAGRYERGYQVEDVRGSSFGTVHAVDRESNLLVLNTGAGGVEGRSTTVGGGGSGASAKPPPPPPPPLPPKQAAPELPILVAKTVL